MVKRSKWRKQVDVLRMYTIYFSLLILLILGAYFINYEISNNQKENQFDSEILFYKSGFSTNMESGVKVEIKELAPPAYAKRKSIYSRNDSNCKE